MRFHFSILSLGVLLLALPTALAQLPPQALPLQRSSPLNTHPMLAHRVNGTPTLLTRCASIGGDETSKLSHPMLAHLTAPPYQQSQISGELKMEAQPGVTFQRFTVASTTPDKPKTRVFEDVDLVDASLQIPGAASLKSSKADTAHTLMKLIVAMTAPESWELGGGTGTIEFIAASDSLCITNALDVLAQVTKLLENLRRLQNQQVSVEVQIVSVRAGFGDKAGWPSASEKGKPKPKYYTPRN